jgi:hypothetical protein
MKIALFATSGAVALAVGLYLGGRRLGWQSFSWTPAGTRLLAGDPADRLGVTLNPNLFRGKAREAYEVAARDPALLARLSCYCGCERTDHHRNLLDCFRSTHGANCQICMGEALDAEAMAKQGMPVEEIRDALRMRYSDEE